MECPLCRGDGHIYRELTERDFRLALELYKMQGLSHNLEEILNEMQKALEADKKDKP